ncbi:MAG TPA: universal stress protein [Burkholderiales bacterium]|nr:universal stress protein [Burkholderiales bacterium]
MLRPRVLLLAHHGTAGARRAERLAFAVAAPGETRIVQLLVVPDFWGGMQGDDWLNNAWTRDAFARHVEGQLSADAMAEVGALAARCAEHGLACEALVRYGDPAQSLLEAAQVAGADLVVIGPPRPKGEPGYRSRMDLEKLVRGLSVPLLVAAAG